MRVARDQKGFTVFEMIITVGLVMFMTAGLVIFTTMFKQLQYEYGTTVKLTNDARITLEKIIWGTRTAMQADREGIWEAQTVAVVNPNELQYTDINGNLHGVRLNGLIIQKMDANGLNQWTTLYDANGAAVDDPASYQTSLVFNQVLPDVVQIQLVLGQRLVGRWYYASLTTQVFARN